VNREPLLSVVETSLHEYQGSFLCTVCPIEVSLILVQISDNRWLAKTISAHLSLIIFISKFIGVPVQIGLLFSLI
jgi:hypothetical protein